MDINEIKQKLLGGANTEPMFADRVPPTTEEIAFLKEKQASTRCTLRKEFLLWRKTRHERLIYLMQQIRIKRGLNVRFLHIRASLDGNPDPKGGATIAYSRPLDKNGKVAYYSITWCKPTDNYCRLEGALQAADSFLQGQSILFVNRSRMCSSMEEALYSLYRDWV